jgi:hypothetical protein
MPYAPEKETANNDDGDDFSELRAALQPLTHALRNDLPRSTSRCCIDSRSRIYTASSSFVLYV